MRIMAPRYGEVGTRAGARQSGRAPGEVPFASRRLRAEKSSRRENRVTCSSRQRCVKNYYAFESANMNRS